MAAEIDARSEAPLYRQISTLLERRIEEGRLRPGDRLPPERELMGLIGVSRSTLRSALSDLIGRRYLSATQGRGNFVLEPPRRRPLRILALERFRADHWSVAPLHYDWISDAAKANHLQIHYHYIPTVEDLMQTLRQPPSGYDGLLIFRTLPEWSEALSGLTREVLDQLSVPIMVIGRPIRNRKMSAVSYDYLEATRRAAGKLIGLGHSRIGFIGGPPVRGHSFMEFFEGYRTAMQAAALPEMKEDMLFLQGEVVVGGVSPESIMTQIHEFLQARRFTAVIVGLVLDPFEKAVQKAGIVLPDELSVIAVTEEAVLDRAVIRWSAMSEPSADMVRRGVGLLREVCFGMADPGVYEVIAPEERAGATCRRLDAAPPSR
ncbi:MAG TPA: GntR family transcriptional regulator [Chthoniobacteraceae bacterium]|nr:GntR family transcriptional regulator [Chthoniobacteraceae bacterium]